MTVALVSALLGDEHPEAALLYWLLLLDYPEIADVLRNRSAQAASIARAHSDDPLLGDLAITLAPAAPTEYPLSTVLRGAFADRVAELLALPDERPVPGTLSRAASDLVSDLIRAGETGLLRDVALASPDPDSAAAANLHLRLSGEPVSLPVPEDARPWYHMLSAAIDGVPYDPVASGLHRPLVSTRDSTVARAVMDAAAGADLELRYRLAWPIRRFLTPESLTADSALMGEAGLIFESLRLAESARFRRELTDADRETLAGLLYPRAFEDAITDAADQVGIPTELAFAKVREESFFSPDIVSVAGAVGLTQLIPATAEDEAARLGVIADDLTDPAQNALIGLSYLARQLERLPNPAAAVAAYNGGGNRLRRWEAELAALPSLSRVLAYEITETRIHVQKVVESAVFYGVSAGREPAAVLRYFFPDLPTPEDDE